MQRSAACACRGLVERPRPAGHRDGRRSNTPQAGLTRAAALQSMERNARGLAVRISRLIMEHRRGVRRASCGHTAFFAFQRMLLRLMRGAHTGEQVPPHGSAAAIQLACPGRPDCGAGVGRAGIFCRHATGRHARRCNTGSRIVLLSGRAGLAVARPCSGAGAGRGGDRWRGSGDQASVGRRDSVRTHLAPPGRRTDSAAM
jgi:hypothetical protein